MRFGSSGKLLVCLALLAAGCATKNEPGVEVWKSRPGDYSYLSQSAEDKRAIWEEEKRVYFEKNPDVIPAIASAVREGRIIRGMTKTQVILASQEYPRTANKSVGAWGETEQCVLEKKNLRFGSGEVEFAEHCYLYFENGILDSWQISR
jgi:hypothetical protein